PPPHRNKLSKLRPRKWHLKALVQKGLSFLPDPEKANHVFQKYVTKGVHLDDEHFGYKIEHASDHIRYAQAYLDTDRDLEILELGTGWYPIIPISFYLSGLGSVTSLDIQSWLTADSLRTAIHKMVEWRADGRLNTYLTSIDEARWEELIQITADPRLSREAMCEKI
ncbi:MAG: hypothetical protein HKN79_06870, partial [Flavobacteriales bacterium]|nr:hypothetical protein [Flavobacteriales bacterium]